MDQQKLFVPGYQPLVLCSRSLGSRALSPSFSSIIRSFLSEAHKNIMKGKKASWLHGCVNITSDSNLERTASEHVNEDGTVFIENSIH